MKQNSTSPTCLLILVCLSFLGISGLLTAQKEIFTLDKSHSYIDFEINYLGMMVQKGRFTRFDGTFLYNPMPSNQNRVCLNIISKSIDTDHPLRDAHLRSPDFLDVEKFPRILFESMEVIGNQDSFLVNGQIEIHGIKKEVQLKVATTNLYTDWQGRSRIGTEGTFVINRKHFGIVGGNSFNNRFSKERLIGDEVALKFSLQWMLQNSTNWPPALSLIDSLKDIKQSALKAHISQWTISKTAKEQLQLIMPFKTAAEVLMYDKEGIEKAILIFDGIRKLNIENQQLNIGIKKHLTVAYWKKYERNKSRNVLSDYEALGFDDSFVCIMTKELN